MACDVMCDVMWWFFHFLREYWRPFRGTTHQKRRCCAFQQFCQPSLSTVPQLRRVARQHLVPKHIGLFVTPGSGPQAGPLTPTTRASA